MKNNKKIVGLLLVVALAAMITPQKIFAATDVIDFENGMYDGFEIAPSADSDKSILSVVDFNGSKALKVDTKDSSKVPKIKIKVCDLVDASKQDTIQTIEFDLVIENPDGKPVAWNGGVIGSEGENHVPAWTQGEDWAIQDDKNSVTSVNKLSRSFKKDYEKFVNNGNGFYLLMRWSGNANDLYIDNIRFLDANGNPIEVNTVAVQESTEPDTTIPKTGVESNAIYLFCGAVFMLIGAFSLKMKGKVNSRNN